MQNYNFLKFKNCLQQHAHKNIGRRKHRLNADMMGLEDIINPFELDYFAILESKALRRLSSKTQVFTSPINLHIRNRRTHTDEVLALSIKIASILGLNTSLCKAIALGHDIGHAPFGHQGEELLSVFSGKQFRHEIFSVVIAQKIERKGHGLNLTNETLNGILHHSIGAKNIKIDQNLPPEYNVVLLSDKISYTFADIQDSRRFEIKYNHKELDKILSRFGANQRERIANCVYHIVKESAEKGYVSFEDSKVAIKFNELKKWMYENIYYKLKNIRLFYSDIMRLLHTHLVEMKDEIKIEPVIFIALMTDFDLKRISDKLFSSPTLSKNDFHEFAAMEVINELENKDIDFTNPDLDW